MGTKYSSQHEESDQREEMHTVFPQIQPGSQVKPGATYPSKLIDPNRLIVLI